MTISTLPSYFATGALALMILQGCNCHPHQQNEDARLEMYFQEHGRFGDTSEIVGVPREDYVAVATFPVYHPSRIKLVLLELMNANRVAGYIRYGKHRHTLLVSPVDETLARDVIGRATEDGSLDSVDLIAK